MASALCDFLNANGLVHRPLALHEPGQWEDFELRMNDLTDVGFEVMRCGLDKWMRGLDRGKPASDTSVLEKCLKKHSVEHKS